MKMKELVDALMRQERIIVCYEQAMINFIAMLRKSSYDPALLKHCDKDADALIRTVYREIKTALPRNKPSMEQGDEISALKQELQHLKSRNLLNKCDNG